MLPVGLTLVPFLQTDITDYLAFAYQSNIKDNAYQAANHSEEYRIQWLENTNKIVNAALQYQEIINKRDNTNVVFNWALKIDNQIVGCFFNIEIHTFLNQIPKIIKIKNTYQYPRQMVRLDKTGYLPTRYCIKNQYKRYNLLNNFIRWNGAYMFSQGYQISYSFTVNQNVVRIANRYGSSKILKQLKINGKKMNFYAIFIDIEEYINNKPKL